MGLLGFDSTKQAVRMPSTRRDRHQEGQPKHQLSENAHKLQFWRQSTRWHPQNEGKIGPVTERRDLGEPYPRGTGCDAVKQQSGGDRDEDAPEIRLCLARSTFSTTNSDIATQAREIRMP